MPRQAAIDTVVLRNANALMHQCQSPGALLGKRLRLLQRVLKKKMAVLISDRLLREYREQVPSPRNEFVRLFFEVLAAPDGTRVIRNWKTPWTHSDRAKARGCRFPPEDDHVLRTAIRGERSAIYTEEQRMILADGCVYREFRVHIWEPA